MSAPRLPILGDFIALHELLTEKANENISFENLSAIIMKKFNRNDYLSGLLLI